MRTFSFVPLETTKAFTRMRIFCRYASATASERMSDKDDCTASENSGHRDEETAPAQGGVILDSLTDELGTALGT